MRYVASMPDLLCVCTYDSSPSESLVGYGLALQNQLEALGHGAPEDCP